jgi:hypothetical protein
VNYKNMNAKYWPPKRYQTYLMVIEVQTQKEQPCFKNKNRKQYKLN